MFMENIIEIRNLNLFFGKYQALYDVNLNLEKGSMHALVGESGSGKTLTAMSIMRLLPKTAEIRSGKIYYHDMNLLKYSERRIRNLRGNKIALIPQDPMTSLNPLYTVGNQLVEAIQVHSDLSKEEAIKKSIEVMDLVKIPEASKKIDSYPHEFSGGMKQRIIIAMALACNAEILIADEPTTALDVTIQKQIMDLISEIKKEFGTTILLITHDLALVSNYADYVSVMYAGHIVEEANSQEFFRHTLHPYSIALLNSLPTINPELKLKTIEGAPPSIQEEISGCKFYPRCEYYKKGLCDTKTPVLTERRAYHYSACLVK